jgi:hypothetical protein
MDGYSGHPLSISNWEDGIEAEDIITEMKKVLNRLQANLIWSSRVVNIRDMTAIAAYQAGVKPGDLLKIRNIGEGILDPHTGFYTAFQK